MRILFASVTLLAGVVAVGWTDLRLASVHAANPQAAPAKPEVLPREKEIELALSAAPDHLRAGAGVYALAEKGPEKVRESSNGFTCIINRDGPMNLKPTCFDAEGTATILPKIVRVGELLMQGKSGAEIAAEIREGFRTGKYISPRRPGVAYMLSGDIRNCSPAGQCGSFPPHVMFYAPNLTNADIGSVGDGANGLPFIAYNGPQAYMIVASPEHAKAGSHEHSATRTTPNERGRR